MSVNYTTFKAVHWDRYVQVGEPKNQSNTSEVPPLFILPVWWQLCEKHMEKSHYFKNNIPLSCAQNIWCVIAMNSAYP